MSKRAFSLVFDICRKKTSGYFEEEKINKYKNIPFRDN